MTTETGKKRQRSDGYRRKHDRNKFRKTTNATVHRKDLGYGQKGFLISCTPHHENQCFRDAVILLGRFCEDACGNEGGKQAKSLEDELSELRRDKNLFTRVEAGVNGAVFVKVNDERVNLEEVAEAALRDARATGNPGSRHCIRLLPIHTTCYAKPEEAAKAAAVVVKEHFPKCSKQEQLMSYAISFRARLNTGAKRDDFIPAIADAIDKLELGYRVDLTKPDVVLLVEVVKTSCCIGVFRRFFELAKMNLREAACPSKPKNEGVKADGKVNGAQRKQFGTAENRVGRAVEGLGSTGTEDSLDNAKEAREGSRSRDVAIGTTAEEDQKNQRMDDGREEGDNSKPELESEVGLRTREKPHVEAETPEVAGVSDPEGTNATSVGANQTDDDDGDTNGRQPDVSDGPSRPGEH